MTPSSDTGGDARPAPPGTTVGWQPDRSGNEEVRVGAGERATEHQAEVGEARLSREDVLSRVWVFGTEDHAFARQLRLLPDGRISGYTHPNEHSWRLDRDRVLFLDVADRVTSAFDRMTRDAAGRLTLCSELFMLRETTRHQSLAPDASGFPLDTRVVGVSPGQRRRNLVLLFANGNSLHHEWPRDIEADERSWDLCVSFYGDAAQYGDLGIAEFSSLQTGIRKCRAAHAAFGQGSALWNYDRVWLADDDLMIGWRDINALFAISANFGFAISQPALAAGSEVTHDITRQQEGLLLRTTSFVEAMAPCFSRDALALCMPVFDRQVLGWGSDHVWPKLIGPPYGRMAIIDAVPMLHTRPLARSYSWDAAKAEEHALLAAYGLAPDVREYGRISR